MFGLQAGLTLDEQRATPSQTLDDVIIAWRKWRLYERLGEQKFLAQCLGATLR